MNSWDAQRPSTYRKYFKGLCEDCWAGCCTLPVEATGSDLVRLGFATADEVEWSHQDVARRLIKQKIVETYDRKTKMFVLAQVAGRDCVFLDQLTRRCTVYEKRPDTCRNFPTIGPRPGFCPYKPKKKSG